MSELPSAKQSPRVVNGVLRAYENDTFDLNIELDLTDQDGTPITVQSTDNIKNVFRDKTNPVIKEFSFTGATNNTVTLDFDAECAALFKKGEYHYDLYYTGSERTTIAKGNVYMVD